MGLTDRFCPVWLLGQSLSTNTVCNDSIILIKPVCALSTFPVKNTFTSIDHYVTFF